MTEPRAIGTRNSLLGLPPELQRMVFDNLNCFDLHRLCLTCKTIKAVVLPQLYRVVRIKAPQRWSRLPSLEGLLGSNGHALRHTKDLMIETQQYPLRNSQQESEDSRSPEEVLTETRLQFYLPQSSTSNVFNTLVRLLILKLPRNCLDAFSWDHSCELDVLTLTLLFQRQKASLYDFLCNRYAPSCNGLGSKIPAVIRGLSDLSIESMDVERGGCRWAALMTAANAHTLDHLSLGFITRIARDFSLQRRPRYDEMSTSFAVELKDAITKGSDDQPIGLELYSLCLCGLDIGKIMGGEMALDIDFSNITALRLESCPGLGQAFSLFTTQRNSPKRALDALRKLVIRFEAPDVNFHSSLEKFLTSIRGLTHLKVLIDNALVFQDLEPIVKIQGKTLATLLWDERRGPRRSLEDSTSLVRRLGTLRVVSENCPSLTTLGVPLNWEIISSSDTAHEMVRKYLRKMPFLEILNIRNLPVLRAIPAMPPQYFVKGLATMFVDIANAKRKSTLKYIALGAPLYRDFAIGTHHVVHTALSDFLRFRAYRIDYNYPSPSALSPVLSEVITGAASKSEDESYFSHFSADYWLG